MISPCEKCGKRGRLGDVVRSYEVSTPLSVTVSLWCWPCAEKMMAKNRKHWRIEDKVQI